MPPWVHLWHVGRHALCRRVHKVLQWHCVLLIENHWELIDAGLGPPAACRGTWGDMYFVEGVHSAVGRHVGRHVEGVHSAVGHSAVAVAMWLLGVSAACISSITVAAAGAACGMEKGMHFVDGVRSAVGVCELPPPPPL